jgi:hypothetical protein
MRVLASVGLLAAALAVAACGQAPKVEAGIEAVAWLSGCWEQRSGERVTLEMWLPPAAGLTLGSNRTVVNGTARAYEQLMLREDGGRLVFVARPSGQAETSFTSTAVSDSGFTVENLAHDFPQRIIYRRVSADSLVARIEGPGPSGTTSRDFPMRRIACTP